MLTFTLKSIIAQSLPARPHHQTTSDAAAITTTFILFFAFILVYPPHNHDLLTAHADILPMRLRAAVFATATTVSTTASTTKA